MGVNCIQNLVNYIGDWRLRSNDGWLGCTGGVVEELTGITEIGG